nr:hypothetical protein [Tanacetum cinerariifolium]
MNQECYNSNSLGFDQPQPPQSPVIHQPPKELKNFNGMSIEIRKKEKLLQEEQWASLSTHPSKRLTSFCYDDDDEDYTFAITPNEPVIFTEEPDNSLSMGDEHLDTISATESDEFIKYGVENLIPIPSESEGIPEHMCDVPFLDNSPPLDVSKDQFKDFSESNEEFSSTDDDSFSFDDIDYVEASPPDYELVSSEVMQIVIPKVGGIEALNDNPIPFYDPIISGTPPNLTPSGESDLFLEVDAFLAVEDEPTSSQLPKSYLDPEGDMLLLDVFLNDDHSSDFKTKSSSTSLNSLLEETNNFDNSLPEFTTFSKVLFDAEYESDSNLVSYLKYFQDTSESSDDSTNVVNAPREPIVVKTDHGVNPPHIDKCCYECGNALDGIFCQQCICKSCGKGAHIGYNCPTKVPIISNPKPGNRTINNEPPQTLPNFDPTCYSKKENSAPCVSKPNFVDESSNIFNPPPQPPIYSCEF